MFNLNLGEVFRGSLCGGGGGGGGGGGLGGWCLYKTRQNYARNLRFVR